MFQESLVGSGAAVRKTWSFAVSLLAQTMAICLVLLATMAYTPLLPAAGFAVWLEAPPPPPGAPPPPIEHIAAVHQAERFESSLLQPRQIPDEIIAIVDPADAPPILDKAPFGVIGSGGPDIPDGVINSIGRSVPKPVEQPKPQPKPHAVAPPAPTGPVTISSSIQAARIIRRVQPEYPILAKQAGVSGTVRLKAVISADGSVEQLNVLIGHPLLVRAAVDAVRQWRYRPTVLNGKPVQVSTEIDVNFVLSR